MSAIRAKIKDLAGKELWDKQYSQRDFPRGSLSYKSYIDKRYDQIFHKYLLKAHGLRILEIGCAQSVWLPYFYQNFGYEVWGLDYSLKGCELAKKILRENGAEGQILSRDVIKDDNSDLHNMFDVVISFGVIEHFDDIVSIISIFKRFLKSDGLIITLIPNYNGLIGVLQKRVGKNLYNAHNIFDKEYLEKAHSAVKFNNIFCNYFGSFNLCMLVYEDIARPPMRLLNILGRLITQAFWWVFGRLNWHPESKFFSPYILYIGKNYK